MSLPPGTTLGPCEVVSFVGAGGMGEVYRARDARLERDVALKVLSPRLASDPEALGRFIYEIAGQRDAALRNLEVALKGGYSMREIANEAEFGKLRADARYQRLLAASQLPATAAK
jgi:serine/threonine protein kinase